MFQGLKDWRELQRECDERNERARKRRLIAKQRQREEDKAMLAEQRKLDQATSPQGRRRILLQLLLDELKTGSSAIKLYSALLAEQVAATNRELQAEFGKKITGMLGENDQ